MNATRTAKKTTAEPKVAVKPAKPAATPGGTKDIITQTSPLWQVILKRLQKIGRTYGFQRAETPIIEEASLYENYYKDNSFLPAASFEAGGKTMAVRPTILPSILRSYIQHKVGEEHPLSKWMYCGNVMALDAATGKIISDYEFGFEVLGTFSHLAEAQTISAAWRLVQGLGLEESVLEINTLGEAECQEAYQEVLRGYLKDKKFELCDDCNELLAQRPLSVLRCNNLDCQVVIAEAPTILDYLDEASQKHFTSVLEALDELQVPYQLNPLHAGPAGAGRTSVIIKQKQGSRTTIIGEGYYHDSLIKQLTGKSAACFGFRGSLAVLEQAMAAADIHVQIESGTEVFLVPLGELASKRSLRLFQDLTAADVRVYDHFGSVGVKNQLKQAEENHSPIALIMGQKEAMDEMVILRDVKSGMQEVFSYDKIVIEVKKRLGK